MSNEPDDLAARLTALEGATGKKAGDRRRSQVTVLLGVLGVAGLGSLGYAALQSEASDPMPTAAPAEFQDQGSGFGDLTPAVPPVPNQDPLPAATGPTETERALAEALAAVRAELDALLAKEAEPSTAADAAIAELTAQVAALQSAS